MSQFETTVIHAMGPQGAEMETGGAARASSHRQGGLETEQRRAVWWQQFERRVKTVTRSLPNIPAKITPGKGLGYFKVDYILALVMAVITAMAINKHKIEDALNAIPPSKGSGRDGFTKVLHECKGTQVIRRTVPRIDAALVEAAKAMMGVIKGSLDDGPRQDLAQYLLQSNYISLPERYFAAWVVSNGGWVPLGDIETLLFDRDQLTSLKKSAWVKFGGRETINGKEVLHMTLLSTDGLDADRVSALAKKLNEADAKEREVDSRGYVIVNKMKKTVLMTEEDLTTHASNVMNLMCAGTLALTKVNTVIPRARSVDRDLISADPEEARRVMYFRVPILKSGSDSVDVAYEFGYPEHNRPGQKIKVRRDRPVFSAKEREELEDFDETDDEPRDYKKYLTTVMHDVASIAQQMVARMNAV